jgi:hypothetical protein
MFYQSIIVIEIEQLRTIFLMLRSELKDTDIPHRTKLRQRILQICMGHLLGYSPARTGGFPALGVILPQNFGYDWST